MTDTSLPFDLEAAVARLISMQMRMRAAVMHDLQSQGAGARTQVVFDGAGDTIYAIDRGVEHVLLQECQDWAQEQPFILIAEGLADGGTLTLPSGADPERAAFRLIFDPLDGTRGLMYDKRSAWILAGLAPNRGAQTSLEDIAVAVQTEAPTTKQYLADVIWAVQGGGAHGQRQNLLSGETQPLTLSPSRAVDLAHGFASLTKFFPGRKAVVSDIEEALVRAIEGNSTTGKVRVFDDQYISTGGQLYELIVGHDRFNGDIRPALMAASHLPGEPPGMAAHPYDICTELIAREAGVVVTDLQGRRLRHALNVGDDVAWLGYANATLQSRLQPVLQSLFAAYGFT